jgi:hypothetical protein
MAIRNDFAPGEVLAAADLNDTFGSKLDYPSGGADGDALIKSGTAAAWSAPDAAGLTLITAEPFGAVSDVSINGCFTSAYQNYSVFWDLTNSNSVEVLLRLRASGADATGSNYKMQHVRAVGTTANNNSETISYVPIGFGNEAVRRFGEIKFYNPVAAAATGLLASHYSDLATPTAGITGVFHSLTNTYDGFTVYPVSGTITGTIFVYGYKD